MMSIGLVDKVSRMSERLKKTVKLVRRGKLGTDERGANVWTGEVEPCELELVSTMELQRIIQSTDERSKASLKEAAAGKEGVLAHDVTNDRFEVIDEEDLKAALESAATEPSEARTADVVYEPVDDGVNIDELSLVSTMALRRMLGDEDPAEAESDDLEIDDKGFDPYNSG